MSAIPVGKVRRLGAITSVILLFWMMTSINNCSVTDDVILDSRNLRDVGRADIQGLGKTFDGSGDIYETPLSPPGGCGDRGAYDAIVMVHSAADNYSKRKVFRSVYNDYNNTRPFTIKMVFVLGLTDDPSWSALIHEEAAVHGDVVQGNFVDHYRNMSIKAIHSFQWVDKYCKDVKVMFRVDDDTFMNIPGLIRHWRAHYADRDNVIMCETKRDTPVQREGVWKVSYEEWSTEVFNFDHCFGWFAAISPQLVPKIHSVAKTLKVFWIDDVFIYGQVTQKIGNVSFPDTKDILLKDGENVYRICIHETGEECPYLASIVRPVVFHRFVNWLHGCKTCP